MTDELTLRQRKFIKGIVSGNSPTEAMKNAGYSPKGKASDIMGRPAVAQFLQKHMERVGITDELLAQKLRDGLNAKTTPKSEGGQRYDDQFVRKQFLDIIFKLRGDYAPERSENITKTINITIDRGFIEALKDSRAISGEQADVLEAEIVRDLPEHEE